jgi:ubiquinone/menaquinone biosynthesis C-methylase UbiE
MNGKYKVSSTIYDPKIYDGLNNTKNEDVSFYLKWINEHKIKSVLELCCGTGRITIPLAKNGINITGLDINTNMLSEAEKKAITEKVSINFIKGDMRSFSLSTKFQLIFIPFNSIHCLYENNDFVEVLKCIYKHLADDGYLIIDYFNPSISYIVNNQNNSISIADYVTSDGRHVQIHQTMKYDDATQVNRVKWEHIINGTNQTIESLDMRIYYPQELNYLLQNNKYEINNKYGNYDQSEFIDGSPIQLIIS